MAQTLEQRLKSTIGDQIFVILDLQRQLEEAQEKIKEFESKQSVANPPLHAVE